VPINSLEIETTTGTGNALPAECAICLSYRGELLSGSNPARRRGRIFLGPLDYGTVDATTPDQRVQPSTMGTIAGAANAMINDGIAGEQVVWAVFSPTIAGAPPWSPTDLEDATIPVLAGYVDNAFDTIRSRGSRPTTRQTFAVTVP